MTASPYFFVFRSSITVSRMKFEGRGSEGEFAPASLGLDKDEFATLILLSILYANSGFAGVRRSLGCRSAPPQLTNPRDNLRRDGKLHSMRSSASSPHLRQEDLPVVRAARSCAAR